MNLEKINEILANKHVLLVIITIIIVAVVINPQQITKILHQVIIQVQGLERQELMIVII